MQLSWPSRTTLPTALLLLCCVSSISASGPDAKTARTTSPDYRWANSLEHDPLHNDDFAVYTFTADRGASLQVNCTPNGRFVDAWVRLPERVYKRYFWHHRVQKLTVEVRLDDYLTTMAWYPQDDKRRLTVGHRDLEKLTSANVAVIGFEARGGKDDEITFEFGHAPFVCPARPPSAATPMPPVAPPPPAL